MSKNYHQLQAIDMNGERVLLTAQLAEVFGTDARRISENYNRNANRYMVGKHYYTLEGAEKREFLKNHTQIAGNSLKNASVIYLWTEKGAWLHAKSLNTDKAWEAYELLVDDYYRTKEQLPTTYKEALLALAVTEEEKERLALEVVTTLSSQYTRTNMTEKGWI